MNNIIFDKAKDIDASRISVLLKTVYIQAYATEGITNEFTNFIDQQFSSSIIREKIVNYPDQFLIAYYKGNPIGVAEILENKKCPIRKIPVSELGKLYVLQRFYGQGIGYGLLKKAEHNLTIKRIETLNLEVYVENKRAIAFYERQGYQKIGKVDFPIENNVYKNWVMTKELS